jgi:hypothetical protein
MVVYQDIYNELSNKLIGSETNDTSLITKTIKNYFSDKFSQYYVAGTDSRPEYMLDITVMTCNPLEIFQNNKEEYKIILAVESELGGNTASSPKNVEKNVIEDYFKILSVISDYKIIIGIYSIPSSDNNTDILKSNIMKIQNINKKSQNKNDFLVILLEGNHTIGNSRQVKLNFPLLIHGYIVKNDDTIINL